MSTDETLSGVAGNAEIGAKGAFYGVEVVAENALGAASLSSDGEAVLWACLTEVVGEEEAVSTGDAVSLGQALCAADRTEETRVIGGEIEARGALTAEGGVGVDEAARGEADCYEGEAGDGLQ